MKRCRAKAFSLVELLVVIGIIALLIAILLPVLARVREQATALKCLANLRTCGQAVEMYSDEHKGYLPFPTGQIDPSGKDCTLWFTVIDPYLSSVANAQRTGIANQRAYSEYKQCPLVNNLYSLASGSSDSQTGSVNFAAGEDTHSYKMNACLRHYDPGLSKNYSQAKVTKVPNSSTFVLLGDGISLDITGLYTNLTAGQTQSVQFAMDPNCNTLGGNESCPLVRHRGTCNILFVDGHAEGVTLPARSPAPQTTGSIVVPVATWQTEYLDAAGNAVYMKDVTPPATTAVISTRNPNMPLQWSDIPGLNR